MTAQPANTPKWADMWASCPDYPWPDEAPQLTEAAEAIARLAQIVKDLERQLGSARDWAVALEGQQAELKRQIREQADQWRVYSPGAFYPEASAYASGIEQCGDALIDLLEDFDISLVAALTGGEDE